MQIQLLKLFQQLSFFLNFYYFMHNSANHRHVEQKIWNLFKINIKTARIIVRDLFKEKLKFETTRTPKVLKSPTDWMSKAFYITRYADFLSDGIISFLCDIDRHIKKNSIETLTCFKRKMPWWFLTKVGSL